MNIKDVNKQFPDGMVPLGNKLFRFSCHPGISCFTDCCKKLELFLYPYDIIKLKHNLQIHSAQFLEQYCGVVQAGNPFFPSVILRMKGNADHTCPFVCEEGCQVYEDRPSACRTYPLERAVDRHPSAARPDDFYFMTNHSYCRGHEEKKEWQVKKWLQDQRLLYYNMMDDLWAEMDTLFSQNPWRGEGAAGPKQQAAFLVCYNIDGFREYVANQNLYRQFKISKAEIREMENNDEALLRFGFKWLQLILDNKPTLKMRR